MQEELLHYIWKTKSFITHQIKTTEGESVQVYTVGSHNDNAGPDFLEAKLKIGDVLWAGHVEIHTNSSDWLLHNHQTDAKYSGVILHVVWDDNQPICYPNGEKIHTVELKHIVDPLLLEKYDRLHKQERELLCEQDLDKLDPFVLSSTVQKMTVERIHEKAEEVMDVFKVCNKEWEETAYRILARSFGLKVNKIPFYELSSSIPFRLLKKHQFSIDQLLALLYGAAGFLEEYPKDEYQSELYQHYSFLKKKYDIKQKLFRHSWNFSRLRPYSFPTVRIARFGLFISQIESLSSILLNMHDPSELSTHLNSCSTLYWQSHYDFGKGSERDFSRAGSTLVSTVLLNTLIPFRVAYANINGIESTMEQVIEWLYLLPKENNKITRSYASAGFPHESSNESQGIIHLHKNYCTKKRCLNCDIGVSILR